MISAGLMLSISACEGGESPDAANDAAAADANALDALPPSPEENILLETNSVLAGGSDSEAGANGWKAEL